MSGVYTPSQIRNKWRVRRILDEAAKQKGEKMEEIIFKKEEVQTSMFIDPHIEKLKSGMHMDANPEEALYYQLRTYIATAAAGKKSIKYIFDRPSFLDWLLRRKKTVTILVSGKDALTEPPPTAGNTIRLYKYEIETGGLI